MRVSANAQHSEIENTNISDELWKNNPIGNVKRITLNIPPGNPLL